MKKKLVVLMMAVAALLLPATVMKADSDALPTLNKTEISVAVQGKGQLELQWPENINQPDFTTTWSVVPGYEQYVSVDSTGNVQGLAFTPSEGAQVKCDVKQEDGGREIELFATVHVTQAHFTTLSPTVAPGQKNTITVTGVNYDTSQITCSVQNENVASLVYDKSQWGVCKLQLQAHNLGVTMATITVDGQTYKMNIIVTNPTLNTTWITTVPGKSKKLTVSQITGTMNPIWISSNKSIASVTQGGVVTFHKRGNASIYVTVDGITKRCAITITYKKAISVINTGKTKLGTPYSQARRMRKGYYDCSSFAWSIYRAHGVYLCSKNSAPVAADEARFLSNTRRVVSYGYASESKLLAGDLIFIKGPYNGRYRNICHVAMYIGNGKILHSTTPYVKISDYSYYKDRITLIGRPLK